MLFRSRFFWEGVGDKRKMHWLNWPAVCIPKDQGGLGIINSKILNIALMAKWLWRLITEENNQALWARIIRAKYPSAANILVSTPVGGSQFWHNLHKVRDAFRLGLKFKLGNGTRILFWTDWWSEESPLSIRFPRLFDICSFPNCSVAQAHNGEGWLIRFRRTFGPDELAQWGQLWAEIEHQEPLHTPDFISWALEPSGTFSTKSLYSRLCQGDKWPYARAIWDASVPLKVKIFTWQLAIDRLPTSKPPSTTDRKSTRLNSSHPV